jgi:hypothetical protein
MTLKYKKFKPKHLSPEAIATAKRQRAPEQGWEAARDEVATARAGKARAGTGELYALIQAKQSSRAQAFDAMTAALEAKYCGPGAAGKSGRAAPKVPR